jgi:hypothetical protein
MKTKVSYSLLAAAMACGIAQGAATAYTTPVGYKTQSLRQGTFSYLGLTTQFPTVSAGVLDAVSASPSSVTDTGVNFSTLLTAGATYILELSDGTIQEVTSWTSLGVLNTPEDVTSKVTAGVTTYKLRKAATIADVFGLNNSAGLTPDNDGSFATGNDLVYVLNAAGVPTIIYYSLGGEEAAAGWYTSGDVPAQDIPIVYADGFYIKRVAGTDIPLVTSGEVKTKPTSGVLIAGFNYLSGVAPAGLTLGNSGLESFLSQSIDGAPFATVDNVLIPSLTGFITCYYSTGGEEAPAGWYTSGDVDASALALEGGFLIRNRGAAKAYRINVPANYSNL